jgi:hypothetical protein
MILPLTPGLQVAMIGNPWLALWLYWWAAWEEAMASDIRR